MKMRHLHLGVYKRSQLYYYSALSLETLELWTGGWQCMYKRWLHKDLSMHFFEVLQLKVNLQDKALESNCTCIHVF